MSITDSTTSLDTTWTERSIVAFTAGTLSDIDDLVTEVQDKLKRGTLSSTTSPTSTAVQRWLIRAKEELMQIKGFSFARRYAYTTLVADDYRVSLPPDYDGGHLVVKDQTNNRTLKFWPAHIYDLKYPDPDEESSDEIIVCCVKNRELWFAPPAGGAYEVEIEYNRSGDDVTPSDFSYLPEIERFRCCDCALFESFESLHMWNEADRYEQKWLKGLGRSRKADSRRKWKQLNYRAISCFEELGGRTYQSND